MDSESPKMNVGGDDEKNMANLENNNENQSKNDDINREHLQVNPDLNHEMNSQKNIDAMDPQTSLECLQRNSEMNLETIFEKDPQQNSKLRTKTMNPVINLVDLETIFETNQSQNVEMNMNFVDLETISETNQSQNVEMNTETMNSKTSLEQLPAYAEMDVQQISDTQILSSMDGMNFRYHQCVGENKISAC